MAPEKGWIVGTLTLKWALETWADWQAYADEQL